MKIAIVKLSSLGDIVHTLPAYRVLRENRKEAEIVWIVEKKGLEIVSLIDDKKLRIKAIDTKMIRKGRNFLSEIKNIIYLKDEKPDLSFDFQGTLKSGIITYLTGAKERIGFSKMNLRERQAVLFYTKTITFFDEKRNVIYKNLHLLSAGGIEPEYRGFPQLNLKEKEQSLKEKIGDEKDYVVFNVGGGWETKILPLRKWEYILNRFKELNKKAFILWGNRREREFARELLRRTKVFLAPELSIGELFPFIRRAKLVVSSDTFPLHIAGMFLKKTVSFWGPSSPERNGPISGKGIFILPSAVECLYCYKKKCKNPVCLERIDEERIFESIVKLLEEK